MNEDCVKSAMINTPVDFYLFSCFSLGANCTHPDQRIGLTFAGGPPSIKKATLLTLLLVPML